MKPDQMYERLVEMIRGYNPQADFDKVQRAYVFAKIAHEGQKRATGEPYIIHPLATAMTLAEMRLPTTIIAAGLLHDVPEDTARTVEDVEKEFGPDVAKLCEGITKVGKIKYRGIDRYIENLRKMFLAMAEDVRVVIIKFADRLHNLETLEGIPPKKQYRVALESLEIYAPIANRLGMGEIRGRLEDAAFKYVYPKEYEWTKKNVETSTRQRHGYLDKVMGLTRKALLDADLKDYDVHGRAKHLYSTYRKLLKNNRNIARIYDLMALRIIVPSVGDCYAALGIVHGHWTPLKGRIKDYMAQPKPNGYRSLHTTVFCEDGEIVEFQIRTHEMHQAAEYGIAAHWAYSETKRNKVKDISTNIDWVSQLADIQQELSDKKAYLDSLEELKIDVFRDRIFVFTPKGDVIDLPEDSTPVDLAYKVHTDIGNTCTSAKVNDDVVSLDQPLKSGDIVEIITDKNRKGPNPDWLKYVKTHGAKSKIRQYARAGIAAWIKGVIPGLKK
ncbi:RelA/SpoT family protein [Patescibacteria group bacterium]|nr:RelA/SpoT family protein [Patescibacteria group bacterium]MBU1448368.1 RelA/SpoT family protein [Patescibacteria group bacterium]MBU2613442.1 RelA/SpoT family protein [Patescibacteria group bacterium]